MVGMTDYEIELADGRSLGVAEWGPVDAPAVLYCHGFPGGRLEPQLAQSTIERHGVAARLIALDRPGYGRSTPAPGRRFLDWPLDLAEAADRIGLESFSVLGASGGSPFALACGLRLADRVTSVGIVAGSGPVEAPGMREAPSIAGPSRFRAIRRWQWRLVGRAVRIGRIDRVVDRTVATMADVDQTVMERPEVRTWYRAVFAEAFAQGGEAAALENELYRRPWGFDPGDVTVETHLWHGELDRWVPILAAAWLAEQIPGAHLTRWVQHGHFSWAVAPELTDVITVLAGERSAADGDGA